MTSGMKVLIIGSTGTLGRQIAKKAIDAGLQVRCMVRRPRKASYLQEWGCELTQGDLLNLDEIKYALKGVDAVIDSATSRPDDPRKDIRQKDLIGGPGKDFGPYSKQAPDYSNVKTGGGSPGQRSKDDRTGGDFAGKGSGNPFGR